MANIREICQTSLEEIGVVGQGSVMQAEDAVVVRRKLRSLLNQWNAKREAVWATTFPQFTLVPNLFPHTIGPNAATFTVAQRPVTIEAISLGLNNVAPTVFLPLNKRDADWWESQSVPELASDIPTDFFYSATWPNGEINFWPVPQAAYIVQLQIRVVLDDLVDFDTTFDLPPGYHEAITLSLAEMCCRPFGRPMPPDLKADASTARAVIFANNDMTPRLATLDSGMEGPGGGMRPSFNYLIGSDSN